MKTMRHLTFAVLGAAMLIAAEAGLRLAVAQESVATWTPVEKARIGVLLEERCDESAIVADLCDNPPVVTSVIVDGPADLAGVTSGDTLLAIDGLSVTSPAGRAALLALEAGVTVTLDLRREGDQVTLEVTPEMRATEPYVEVRTKFFGPEPELAEIGEGIADFRVIRIPSVRSRLGEVEIHLDSLGARANGFVFFHQDSVGRFRIEVGDSDKAEVIVDRSRYLWENEELAHRLTRVRDSSLRTARAHLDSLVRLQHRVRVGMADSLDAVSGMFVEVEPDNRWTSFVGPRQVSGQVRSLFTTDLRVAGAEFRELDGDLAEYFDGADQGLLVIRVIPETPAARTGLRGGDVVVEVNGEKCHQISTLRRAMATAGPFGELQVVWVRKGTRHSGSLGVN